ncbi:LPS assembly lipoprotein LptE [Algoriphagus aquimarinus]|uniref:Lipopolysaccharide-assembly n=1 Tax=Algoriphagus aquimarinus TaxID=237018 RepID=A0A1I1ABG0_9BACT|nr:LptE family protein [Algoriphagus aquimarinus]SFB33868.1 Lipopolysaccharide-assembly [Algoriphagus aquimarinus]|tara:strand:- start:76217 stop:76756 length:540 start_codon:yes stop_codon:yes gene_type:complete
MKSTNKLTLFALGLVFLLFQSCAVKYSFTGTNINYEEVKTFTVDNFFNDSGGGTANIEQKFTEALKEYYQRNTQLELVRSNGNLQFMGAITRYTLTPQAAVSSGDPNLPDRAGNMRLTISVEVEYINTTNEEENLKRAFSFYQDYDPRTTTFLDVESDLVDEIFTSIIQDIFTATVANW